MALYLIGDGTAAEGPGGWGAALRKRMPGAAVFNAAAEGASSKSFLAEAKLQESEEKMKEGDVLLIQFGWNDAEPKVWLHTDPFTSYMNCLSICADTARTWGTVPVILTQIPRCAFADGELQASGGDYPQAARLLARRLAVPVIDVYQRGFDALQQLGEEKCAGLYAETAGAEPVLTEAGAALYAGIVFDGLKELGLLPGREQGGEDAAESERKPAAAAWRTEEGGD